MALKNARGIALYVDVNNFDPAHRDVSVVALQIDCLWPAHVIANLQPDIFRHRRVRDAMEDIATMRPPSANSHNILIFLILHDSVVLFPLGKSRGAG